MKKLLVILMLLGLSSCYLTGPEGSFSFDTAPNRYDFYRPYYYHRPYYYYDPFFYPRRPNIIIYSQPRTQAPRRENLQPRSGSERGSQAPVRKFPKKDD